MTRMSLPSPTLHTARLRLRPFAEADANDLFALHSNADVLRFWDAPPWSERMRADRFITACRQMAEGGTGRGWPWIVCPTGRSSADAA
ncbi:MAG TPA: GNAT family N-acetyltransferase [Nocardioidaceae bacterium]|nr:GNAT family N-acetyltransferase [Nocardioidaceae bacterium]